ncbi:MAG: YeeE/YedE family protein [Rhodobacteraceae bacterium]|nr:YeeE/YedE family protein [Paracoccaceae bacterium]
MIDTWKEMVVEDPAFYIGWGGLLIGVVFGYIVYITNFCTMGSINDIMSFGDYRRLRSWLLGGAVSIIGVAILTSMEVADFTTSQFLAPQFNWLGNIVGGLIFGIGMVYAGGCLSKNLVRTGAGDLRSLVVLIIAGLFGFMTIGGLLGPVRVALFGPSTINLADMDIEYQGLGDILAGLTGMDYDMARTVSLAVVLVALLGYCFMSTEFRKSPNHIFAGVALGLCVTAGWLLTALAQDDFADVPVALISLSFARPSGDVLDYLMRYTALGAPGFGVVTLIGVLLGGFVGAISKGKFHLATFANSGDAVRNMLGAALMGIGAVLSLGCTIGQGMTGLSTLAAGSFITLAFIIIGGIVGVKIMEWDMMRG